MKDKLVKLLLDVDYALDTDGRKARDNAEFIAEYLLSKGVLVTPCVAMVEQFLKDGKFDNKITAHNGKYAVVYLDKSKWNSPLIDITEQAYNAENAIKRIEELKGVSEK